MAIFNNVPDGFFGVCWGVIAFLALCLVFLFILMTRPVKEEEKNGEKKQSKGCGTPLIIILILSILIGIVGAYASGMSPEEAQRMEEYREKKASDKKNEELNLDAWNCATDVVKKELYQFSNVKVSSYHNSTVTYTSSTEIYTIKGTVSYKNAFNATVNNKFTVQLKLTEHGYSDSSVLFY